MKVKLPDRLENKEYEEAVSSYIRAFGYFVENRIILDHKGKEILELDTVVTPISSEFLNRILVDAKSGKNTGFADIFKIFGWKHFLDIPKGCIVRKTKPEERDTDALEEYHPQLNVSWETFNIDEDKFDTNIEKTFPVLIAKKDDLFINVFLSGWWAAIAERICYREYKNFTKACQNEKLVTKLKQYEKACMLSFFEKDPIKRVIELYSAFKKNPHISNECIQFLSKENSLSEKDVQDSLFNENRYLWAQYVMLLEHRVRILIIKCAVEIILMKNVVSADKRHLGYLNRQHLLNTTPNNFQRGLIEIEKNTNMIKIPYLFHLFLEIFGGFYIDECEKDKNMLSKTTAIDEDQIIKCLEIFNVFFPTRNGWFQSSKDVVRLKFVPLICRGAGAFCRDKYLCNDYNELSKRDMGWLIRKYHNSYVGVLSKDIEVKEVI